MGQTSTPLRRLIEMSLEGTLEDYVVEARNQDKTWSTIARDLSDRTGCRVSSETLRQWFDGRLIVVLRPDEPAQVSA